MTRLRLILIAVTVAAVTLAAFTTRKGQNPPIAIQQTGSADLVEWMSLEEAQLRSQKDPRRIFIYFYTNWAGWCKVMDKNTFNHPVIAAYMNENCLCVRMNGETTDTIDFNGQQFTNQRIRPGRAGPHTFTETALQGRVSYPSYAFYDAATISVTILQGYLVPQQFEPYLHYYANEKSNGLPWEEFLKTFKTQLPSGSK